MSEPASNFENSQLDLIRKEFPGISDSAATEIHTLRRDKETLLSSSVNDDLTGLLNRKGLRIFTTQMIDHARRSSEEISVAVIDMDKFKVINDTYGHKVGDRCLQVFSAILRKYLARPEDVIARTGGDELAVVLPNTNNEQAEVAIDRFKSNLAEELTDENMKRDGIPEGVKIGCSIGLSQINVNSSNAWDEAFNEADTKMYKIKRAKEPKPTNGQ